MARRAITVTDLLGEAHHGHNGYLDSFASTDPDPSAALIAAEEHGRDDVPRILLAGCRSWPIERLPACGACKGNPLPIGWYCLVCDTPRGSLVGRARAAARRLADKAAKDKLRGGTGGRRDKRAG